MSKAVLHTNRAPSAIGTYSQAVVGGPFVFVSGQIGLDPETGNLVEGGVGAQTRRVLENMKAILEEAGSSMEKVVKCSVLLTDIKDFDEVNGVYAGFFPNNPPARVAYAVAGLPRGANVEIDAIALAS